MSYSHPRHAAETGHKHVLPLDTLIEVVVVVFFIQRPHEMVEDASGKERNHGYSSVGRGLQTKCPAGPSHVLGVSGSW